MTTIFDPLHFSAVSMDVLTCAQGTAQAIAARQQSRLVSLLGSAMRDSRFYREHLHGTKPDTAALGVLPPVSRQALMDRFDDWVTDPQLKLSELRAFTADSQRIGQAYLGQYLVWESSGTSHQPGIFVQNAQTMAVYDALEALRRNAPRPLQRWFDPLALAERIAYVGATSGHFASAVSMQRLRELHPWLAPSMRSFSILQSTRLLVNELNAFAPTVIATYPTVAAVLADEADRGALHFAPSELWTGGETLSPAVRRRLELGFGCAVRNSYGASEFMSIAWECAQQRMHVNADWVILEPVDAQGRPMPVSEWSYTTLLTNLANHVQPLIRYDLGDQVRLCHKPCDCGSALPVIEVLGRRDDAMVMAGRRGQPVTLLPLALTTVLEDEAGVFDFHLCQRNERTLLLRLALEGPEGEAAMARCRAVLKNFADAQELMPIRVLGELGQAMPRGRSGKGKRIVACRAARTR
ncbi:phenylacetate--CoA ligase family protein [Rhodoferax sp.]|uniref:phenylacetate--CoA ligase family protein n=1 Tax=Rhodoferax sp. TaxID=50421 RepID=UPI00260A0ADC|nr:phenylacetate--CoA ligase family protein [Rhodoferax sp.]MDD2919073.1 phenylacetate--CoA ligase family protein [Rhodoferax sp.]